MNKLYLVATPIGNLGDITLRALEILRSVSLIACEDTRVTGKLLSHYQIKTKLVSYHQHSGSGRVDWLIDYLKNQGDLALVTDAGTPGIADPGNQLVAEAVARLGEEVEIIPLPGASALAAALSISGMPTDRFIFWGFLPHKKGKETIIKKIIAGELTSVFYESTHRIIKTLEKIKELMSAAAAGSGETMPGGAKKKIMVCRELTKKFETIYRGDIDQVLNSLKNDNSKGEFTVIIS